MTSFMRVIYSNVGELPPELQNTSYCIILLLKRAHLKCRRTVFKYIQHILSRANTFPENFLELLNRYNQQITVIIIAIEWGFQFHISGVFSTHSARHLHTNTFFFFFGDGNLFMWKIKASTCHAPVLIGFYWTQTLFSCSKSPEHAEVANFLAAHLHSLLGYGAVQFIYSPDPRAKLASCVKCKFGQQDMTPMISKNTLKCQTTAHFSTFSPSQMSLGPEKLAAFLDAVNIGLLYFALRTLSLHF